MLNTGSEAVWSSAVTAYSASLMITISMVSFAQPDLAGLTRSTSAEADACYGKPAEAGFLYQPPV
jgi:hypothetical protein